MGKNEMEEKNAYLIWRREKKRVLFLQEGGKNKWGVSPNLRPNKKGGVRRRLLWDTGERGSGSQRKESFQEGEGRQTETGKASREKSKSMWRREILSEEVSPYFKAKCRFLLKRERRTFLRKDEREGKGNILNPIEGGESVYLARLQTNYRGEKKERTSLKRKPSFNAKGPKHRRKVCSRKRRKPNYEREVRKENSAIYLKGDDLLRHRWGCRGKAFYFTEK